MLDLKHPILLILVTAVVGGVGWLISNGISRIDLSDLRIEIEHSRQAIDLTVSQPKIDNVVVYCDTVQLSLVVSHNQKGTHPVLVNRISLVYEPVKIATENSRICKVDALSSTPFGVAIRNSYVITLDRSNDTARYIESTKKNGAWPVSTSNLLDSGDGKKSLILKGGEEPTQFDVYLTNKKSGVYRIWFRAEYDANGPKVTNSNAVLLGG
jgi:hypothetical protein